jgi:hypothetical protein
MISFLMEEIKMLKSQVEVLNHKVSVLEVASHQNPSEMDPMQKHQKDKSGDGLDQEKSTKQGASAPVRQSLKKNNAPGGSLQLGDSKARRAGQVSSTARLADQVPPGSTVPGKAPAGLVEEEWQEVRKGATKASPPFKKSFKDVLKSSTPEETLKKVLQEETQERSQGVIKLQVKLNLTAKARKEPLLSWRAVLKALNAPKILGISLLSPSQAELYVEKSRATELEGLLRSKGYLCQHCLSERDVARRARDYLHGYFLPLRRAALEDLSPRLRAMTLKIVEEKIQEMEPIGKKQWNYQLQKDLLWLNQAQDSTMNQDI